MAEINRSNIILTGPHRSGTTLTCHLLNKLTNVVALHEPMNMSGFSQAKSREQMVDQVQSFFVDARRSITDDGVVASKHCGGEVPDNTYTDKINPNTGKRIKKAMIASETISIDKQLDEGFSIVVKHPAAFTALLSSLTGRFPVYAVVRNPLSILLSWNSLDLAVSNGRAPAAEKIDTSLALALDRIEDKIDRQIFLLGWYFQQYKLFLPRTSVIYYEELISSRGGVLEIVAATGGVINETLQSKNDNPVYDQYLRAELIDRLRSTDESWGGWGFYSKKEVLSDRL